MDTSILKSYVEEYLNCILNSNEYWGYIEKPEIPGILDLRINYTYNVILHRIRTDLLKETICVITYIFDSWFRQGKENFLLVGDLQ